MLALPLLLLVSDLGLGVSAARIPDRNNDGLPELVLGVPSHTKDHGALLLVPSGSTKIEVAVQSDDNSARFGWDIASVEHFPTDTESRLLVSDPQREYGDSKSEGVVHLLKADLSAGGEIRSAEGEHRFGIRLYVPASTLDPSKDPGPAVVIQFETLDDESKANSGRESFAIYDLRTRSRRGVITGSRRDDHIGGDLSLVCAWVADCNDDGLLDLAVDLCDSVALYSGANLKLIRKVSYAKYLTSDNRAVRTLAFVKREASLPSSLAIGFPGRPISEDESSFLLMWSLKDTQSLTRVDNPGCGSGFGTGLCQISSGELFATGNTPFEGCLSVSKPFVPEKLTPLQTDDWLPTKGQASPTYLGTLLRNLGDMNGDGIDDVAVSAMNPGNFGFPGQGLVVVSGRTHNPLLKVILDSDEKPSLTRY